MILSFKNFSGVAPAIPAALLADNAAQTATNTDLFGNAIRSFYDVSTVATPTKAGTKLSIHRFGKDSVSDSQYWFTWTTAVSVARGLVAADTSERTYYTGDGAPKVTDSTLALSGGSDYPMAYYTLGVPAPTTAPTLTPSAADATTEERAYVYTYVTGWGEESAPSPAQTTTVNIDGTVDLSLLETGPIGTYNVTTKRVYRSVTTSTGTDYFYVGSLAVATTTFSDTATSDDLGETLQTLTWATPPTDLDGLVYLYEGMLAGFHGKEVCISEPYAPYAWPEAYRLTVDYDVVGIGVMPQAFLILTKGAPYMVTGTDPSNFNVQKLELEQACTSRRSIARVGPGVVYASPDGLVYVDTSGAKLLTEGFFRRADWQALVPTSIHGIEYDGRYYFFYNSTAGYVYVPEKGFVALNFYATACHKDPQTDALYFAISTTIKKWNASSSKLSYTWKSKKVTLPALVNLGCGKMICDSYSTSPTLKIYADGTLKHTQTVTSSAPFWLPSGFRAQTWEVQVEGTADVYAIHLADSPLELKDVI